MEFTFEDPEIVQLIQQYLHEHGLTNTLKMLEQESGVAAFDPETITQGHKLETMHMEHKEMALQRELNELELDERRSSEKLLEKGNGTYIQLMLRSLDSLHHSNILCLAFSFENGSNILATGSTDKLIKLSNYETKEVIAQISHHTGAVLSLNFNPVHRHLLLSSSMDGSSALIDIRHHKVIQTFNDHKKYVVSVKWSPDGLSFATASHDHSVSFYRTANIDTPFALLEQFHFNANPESIAFMKNGTLVIGVRDDNYLYFVNPMTLAKEKFNMNAALDDHVSFTPMHISFGLDDEYFLVSTDKDRMIMYRVGSSTPVRNFWGAPNDGFSNPRNCWDPTGKYVYSTSQDHKIYCWEVATQSIVQKLEGHTAPVRDLQLHPNKNSLASCSFDKSVKLWIPKQ
jgi:COMPASS component SWD3